MTLEHLAILAISPTYNHNLKPCGAQLEDKTESMFVLDKLAYVGPKMPHDSPKTPPRGSQMAQVGPSSL